MAIYRQVHISFWQDAFILSLTPEEKYFYLYLMTNSKTSQCGIYEISEKIITLETGYNEETVNKLLNKFIKFGKIEYNKKEKEIFLVNWIKYNGSSSPKIKLRIELELKSVKTRDFVNKFNTVYIRYGYSIDTQTQEEPEEEEEPEKKEEPEEEENTISLWNVFANENNLAPIIKLSSKRIKYVSARKKEKDFEIFKIFEKIRESPFLLGDNERNWKVDFDFVFSNTNNYLKILEGKYNGKGSNIRGTIDFNKWGKLLKESQPSPTEVASGSIIKELEQH